MKDMDFFFNILKKEKWWEVIRMGRMPLLGQLSTVDYVSICDEYSIEYSELDGY